MNHRAESGETDEHEDQVEVEGLAGPAVVDRWAGTEHQRSGGAERGYGLLLVITGVLGTLAATMLTIEYIHTLRDENYVPVCDINPFLTCGAFLGSEQSQAFGFPNVVIGMVAFPVVVTTGVLLLAGLRLPRWYWRGLLVGTVFGIGFVLWLQYHAFFSIRAICPWCALVWVSMIPLFVHTLARATQNGALPATTGLRSLLVQYRWVLTVLWYVVLVAVALIALADQWTML